MRNEAIVAVGAALLIAALAGVEWWAEHQWTAADVVVAPADTPEFGLPDTPEVEAHEPSASPRLSR